MSEQRSDSGDTGAADGTFVERVVRYLDGTLPEEGVVLLNRELAADPGKRQMFVRLCLVESLVLEELSQRQEMPAAGQTREELNSQRQPKSRKLEKPAPARPTRRRSGLSASPRLRRYLRVPHWATAAVVLLAVGAAVLLYSKRPARPGGPVVVATLTAEVGTQWDGPAPTAGKGLTAATSWKLAAGYAELTFAGGARVVVEGPTQFTVESPTAASLTSGKLAATVSGGRFIVRTPTATVTDLGTEFGVSADATDGTRVDVFKGSVNVEPLSIDQGAARAQVLSEGQAGTVTGKGVVLDPDGADPQRFVRNLAGEATALDMADLVCGGDGTTHRRGQAIDVLTGQVGALAHVGQRVGDGRYHRILARPVLDGCFVPDGSHGPVQVDSAGHRFGFPATDNTTHFRLWAGGPIPGVGGTPEVSATLNGVDYSQPGHGLLFIHSNKGLTFDLDAIRRLHPGLGLARFRCTIGNSYAKDRVARADAYVLVDGEPRFQRRGFTNKTGPLQIAVPLAKGDRFLTLAVTDGGDSTGYDWILWADPLLDAAGR